MAEPAFLAEPGKHEVESQTGLSVLCVPASTWIRPFIPLFSCAICLARNAFIGI